MILAEWCAHAEGVIFKGKAERMRNKIVSFLMCICSGVVCGAIKNELVRCPGPIV